MILVGFGFLAILIPALMVMDTTMAVDMMAAGMVVAIVAVEMAVEDIDIRRLPPNKSPGAHRHWSFQFRIRGSRRESAVAQLSTVATNSFASFHFST
jgi:hypothetical protein